MNALNFRTSGFRRFLAVCLISILAAVGIGLATAAPASAGFASRIYVSWNSEFGNHAAPIRTAKSVSNFWATDLIINEGETRYNESAVRIDPGCWARFSSSKRGNGVIPGGVTVPVDRWERVRYVVYC